MFGALPSHILHTAAQGSTPSTHTHTHTHTKYTQYLHAIPNKMSHVLTLKNVTCMEEKHVCPGLSRDEFYIECNLRQYSVQEGCTNPLRQIAVVNKFCMLPPNICRPPSSGVPRNFVQGGSTNSVEDRGKREPRSGGGSPLARGSGGSSNLVREISFHVVKLS
jgi:hypothetical protein